MLHRVINPIFRMWNSMHMYVYNVHKILKYVSFFFIRFDGMKSDACLRTQSTRK